MKVKLKSVLKTTDTLFEPFQQSQIAYHAGNTICIKEFYKNNSSFICLSKQLNKLFTFKPSPNKKGCFVAEKILNQKICISYYPLKGQRKTICLTDSHQFFPYNLVEGVQLLTDQFDSSLVYGYAKSSGDYCIFLVDFTKLKVVAMGFFASFNDMKVNPKQNLTLSLCYGNSVRSIHVYNGFWETDQKIYKKIGNSNVIRHEFLSGDVQLLCTKSHLYFMDQFQIQQQIQVYQHNQDEIVDVLKIPKAILVLSKNNQMKIYVEDSDEVNYLFKDNIKNDFKEKHIIKIVLSSNHEEVLLRTNTNQVFMWRTDQLDLTSEVTYSFIKVEEGTVGEAQGGITIASGKQHGLLGGTNSITLWDLQKNTASLSAQFFNYQKKEERAIFATAINPDGNSFIAAFDDKVKIFKILLTTFRFIAQFSIKKCRQFVYSHGGHFVACVYGKGANSSIVIINSLRMSEVMTFKIHAEPLNVIWNEMDDELIISNDNDQINSYRISQSSKVTTVKLPQKINYIRLDYSTKKLLASSKDKVYIIQNGCIQSTIQPKVPNFNFMFPLHGIYFATSKNGSLYWSNNLNFENSNQLPIFTNKPYSIIYRNGYMIAYTSFLQISIIQCLRHDLPPKKKLLKTSQDIVFVQRDQIAKFFQKVKNLQSNLQQMTNSTSVKLQEQKKKYDEALQQNTNKFKDEISFLQKRFQQLSYQKIRQEKQNGRVFDDLQEGQMKSVSDIEKMYDRKLRIQKEKYMDLQQKHLQQKTHYQKVIYELELRYHKDIEKIRAQYSEKLKLQYKKIQQNKNNDLEYKKKMEYKLINIQEQSEVALYELQRMKDDKIKELSKRIVELQNLYDGGRVQMHNHMNTYKEMEQSYKTIKKQLEKAKIKLQQGYCRIRLLEGQIEKKDKMVEERNKIIEQNQHQIGGLQKAKYVLSFRTTQIRKELQPKESLIDKLKSQLFKLDDQFKEEKKKLFETAQKAQKLSKLNAILKQENQQVNIKLKSKTKIHDEICSQIYTIVNEVDQKEWPPAFIKIYQDFIRQDEFKSRHKKKKDPTSQEINRHLIHLEQSLVQVSSGNQKILKGKDIDVKRKMKQNAQLVYDLNIMRKRQNQLQNDIKQKNNQIATLKREIHESNRTSTRANTAKSIGTRRLNLQSRQKNPDMDFSGFDLNLKRDSEHFFDKKDNSRTRISSAHKTMIWRDDKKERSKFFDLAKQLESSRNTIRRQDKMIEQLNQRLLGLPEDDL